MKYDENKKLWEIDSKIYLTDEELKEYINRIFEDKNGDKENENKSR